MQFAIIIPDGQAPLSDPFETTKKWDGSGSKSNVVSLAYVGRCTQTIVDEEHLIDWIRMFTADTSAYNRFYIERINDVSDERRAPVLSE